MTDQDRQPTVSDLLRVMPARQYSLEERRLAAISYLIEGTAMGVERVTGIPNETVSSWIRGDGSAAEWWPMLLKTAAIERQAQLDAKLTAIVHRALDEVDDRLQNGEHVVIKGEIHKLPIRAKDAAVIAGVAYDKRALLRGQATSRREVVNLEALRGRFAQVIEGKAESLTNIEETNPMPSALSKG